MYLSPTEAEVRGAMHLGRCEANADSVLVADMANLAAGGEVLPAEQWQARLNGRLAWSFKDKEGESSVERETRRDRYCKNMHAEALGKASFLQQVELTRAPGISPLSKAVMVLNALQANSHSNANASKNRQARLSGSGGGESTMGVRTHDEAEELANSVNSVLDNVEHLPEDFLELLDERGDVESGAAELFSQSPEYTEKLLEIARKIGESSLVTTTRKRSKKVNRFGAETETRPLRDIAKVRSLTPRSRSMLALGAIGRAKLATGALRYARRYDFLDQKTLLYILIDCSGSMNTASRRGTALGCLHAMVAAVKAGAAELFLRFFDGDVTALETLTNPDEAGDWLRKQLESSNFSGGCTRIGSAVTTAIHDIAERDGAGRLLTDSSLHPEILLVTDGEDSVSLSLSQLGGVKLHMVQIGSSENETLRDLVRENRGLYLQVGD